MNSPQPTTMDAPSGSRHSALRTLAANWRAEEKKNGHELIAGWVVIFGGEVTGWTLMLDRPESFVPGVVAVPADDGPCYLSAGGNESARAKEWKAI